VGLSPPQRLLLVHTSERKIRERECWREKRGARGTVGREKAGESLLSLFPSQRSPRALILFFFPASARFSVGGLCGEERGGRQWGEYFGLLRHDFLTLSP